MITEKSLVEAEMVAHSILTPSNATSNTPKEYEGG